MTGMSVKYNDSDPRNNMVEPKIILDEFKKLDTTKPVACCNKIRSKLYYECKLQQTAEDIATRVTQLWVIQ